MRACKCSTSSSSSGGDTYSGLYKLLPICMTWWQITHAKYQPAREHVYSMGLWSHPQVQHGEGLHACMHAIHACMYVLASSSSRAAWQKHECLCTASQQTTKKRNTKENKPMEMPAPPLFLTSRCGNAGATLQRCQHRTCEAQGDRHNKHQRVVKTHFTGWHHGTMPLGCL